MAYSSNDVFAFSDLFQGNDEAYGTTIVGDIVEGKAQSSSQLVHAELSSAVVQRHLAGEQSIGVAPINSQGMCHFGAIDIDSYPGNLLDIVKAIEDFNLPLFPCYSKSKKLHLYMFFSEEVSAEDTISLLRWYADAFSLGKKVEIFPKQSKARSTNKFYSWINLPYFDANNEANHRKLVRADGTLVSLSDALERAHSIQWSLKEHQTFIEEFVYKDAPPCILTGLLLRDIGRGQRNNWLFSVGVYLRMKDENADLETLLCDINNSLQDPIPEEELRTTIIKGFQRKSYFYMCGSLDRCDKARCRHTEYGIDSKESTGLDYGELTQYLTDPPYYDWIINGQKLTFWSEQEILTQTKFQALCLRQLHLVPRKVKEERWAKIITRACENINVVKPVAEQGDFTTGSTFFDIVCSFFNTNRRADNITQIAMGRVFYDEVKSEYIFTAHAFIDYVITKNDFRRYAPVEMRARLIDMGAYQEGQAWHMPANSIPVQPKADIVVDFRDKEKPGDMF